MKSMFVKVFVVAALAAGLVANGWAQEAKDEKTIKGKGMCAKCELKKADTCQNAIKTKEDGKEVVYFLEANDVSKKFHKNVCSAIKDVVAKGTVKKEGDKLILVAKEIKLDEKP